MAKRKMKYMPDGTPIYQRRTFGQYMGKNWFSYSMVAPFFIAFIVFEIAPLIVSFLLSFTSFNGLQMPRIIGWDNYATLFLNDPIFMQALRNTLVFAFLTGPLSYLLALTMAWFVNELPKWIRTVMVLILYAPSLTGQVWLVWKWIFSGDVYGLLNTVVMKFGMEPVAWVSNEKYIMTVLIVVQLWMAMGTGFLAMIAGLRNVDHELYEAGAIDGLKNRWQEMLYITIPSIAPQMLFAAVMQIASSFAVAEVSRELAGFPSANYAGHTIVLHMYDYTSTRFEFGYSATIAVIMFIIILGTNRLVTAVFKRTDTE